VRARQVQQLAHEPAQQRGGQVPVDLRELLQVGLAQPRRASPWT
jgi:hypothetical protein